MATRTTAAVCLALLCIGGCTSYYKVTDPTTGREYYTTELQRKNSGAATLKDGRTGNIVNLQNSEIAQVSKEQYDAGRYSTPAPADADAQKAEANPFK
jgi:hypothetical protein